MFVEVGRLQFPIPFPQIRPHELKLVEKVDRCRQEGQAMLGEAKMSDRQTVILLAYSVALLLRNRSFVSPSRSTATRSEEKKVRSVLVP